jgi:outer membrane protein OmpA-like peptidoglycan-associated protein
MRLITVLVAVAGIAGAVVPALAAGPAYSPDDIVKFMVKAQAVATARGVCVGTVQECAQMSKPEGFDMMVNFDLNSANLTSDAAVNLVQVGKALGDPRLKGAKFEVDGYTDATGTVPYNDELSQRRAASVAQFLTQQGVGADRLVTKGLGESSPRVANAFDPVNRRVEIRLSLQ